MGTWTRFKNRLIARVITRFPSLSKRFIDGYRPWESEDVPWTDFSKPLSRCRVAVVTTAGVHHVDQPPFDMDDEQGDPSYRRLDLTRPASDLMITHDYYDHSHADQDINIIFPVDRLREFEQDGIIGEFARYHYGFMGHVDGTHLPTLIERSGPDVAARLKDDGADVVLFTPG